MKRIYSIRAEEGLIEKVGKISNMMGISKNKLIVSVLEAYCKMMDERIGEMDEKREGD